MNQEKYRNIIEYFFKIGPFSLEKKQKSELLTNALLALTNFHRDNCHPYGNLLSSIGYSSGDIHHYRDLPCLPVKLFKSHDLLSIPPEDVFKTMTSSGTTGQSVSKIFLDRTTAASQSKALVRIMSSFLESTRLPMIIIDSPNVVKDRNMFSARGAGIIGFSVFAKNKIYALDENMRLDRDAIDEFLNTNKGKPILVFGFTFMIWQHFYHELLKTGYKPDLSRAVMIHGGGWKKLVQQEVSKAKFAEALHEVCGIERIHDYYGMVEQTGTVFAECEQGHLHASVFGDVIIRDPYTLAEVPVGEKGIIQVLSILPYSYPGHSLLTEDEGVVLGEDDCACGRLGKYFSVEGRVKNAEMRGCSDTYATDFLTR